MEIYIFHSWDTVRSKRDTMLVRVNDCVILMPFALVQHIMNKLHF